MVGYANSPTLSPDFNSNWNENLSRVYLSEGGFPPGWDTTSNALDFDYALQPDQSGQPVSNFYYNPANGPLLIEIARSDRSGFPPLWDVYDNCSFDDENRTIAGDASNQVTQNMGWSCPFDGTLVPQRQRTTRVGHRVGTGSGWRIGSQVSPSAARLAARPGALARLHGAAAAVAGLHQRAGHGCGFGRRQPHLLRSGQPSAGGRLGHRRSSTPFGTLTVWMRMAAARSTCRR